LGADIDVRRGGGGLAGGGGVAERGVERWVLVRHQDEARRLASERRRLGDGLLVEGELGAGGEEQQLDAAGGHGGPHRLPRLRPLDALPGGIHARPTLNELNSCRWRSSSCAPCASSPRPAASASPPAACA